MNKKITIAILSILTIFFLTAQTCSIPSVSTGQESDCTYDGEILCDEDDSTLALECLYNGYGGFYLSDGSDEDNVEYCGATEEFNEERLARILLSLSSDLEDIIEDLRDLKIEGRVAEADGDGRALVMIRAELSDIRTSLAEISTVLDTVVADVADAAADGEDVSDVQTLYDTADADLTEAESLEADVSEQIMNALASLSGSGTDCSTDPTICTTGEACSSASVCETDTDGDGDADSDDTDDDNDGYTDTFEATAGTDPLDEDTDDDGLTDYEEQEVYYTHPLDEDTDGDGVNDGDEVDLGSNPMEVLAGVCLVSSTRATVGDAITFDGTSSRDASSYSWDFDDDGSEDSTSASYIFSYSSANRYVAVLTVSDGATTDIVVCDAIRVNEETATDTDGDLMPDSWEETYGFSTTSPNTALGDADHDGLTNLQEYQAGSDPWSFEPDNYRLDEDLLFKLEDFTGVSVISTGQSVDEVVEESDNGLVSANVVSVTISTSEEYLFFSGYSSSEGEDSRIVFKHDGHLAPEDWVIVEAEVSVTAGTEHYDDVIFVSKETEYCGSGGYNYPLYKLGIKDNKYQFLVSVNGLVRTVTSTTDVSSTSHKITGVYDGNKVYLYVDDVSEDEFDVDNEEISSLYNPYSLTIGDSRYCDVNVWHAFNGRLYSLNIWGE